MALPQGILHDCVNCREGREGETPATAARVRVCWPEDQTPIKVPLDLEPFVLIVQPVRPDAMAGVLKAHLAPPAPDKACGWPWLPFDVYIPDHHLDEPNSWANRTVAAAAEAAGLSAAVMLASWFPNHPATVVPYTAYSEQIKSQWALVQLFTPPYVNLCRDNPLGKLDPGEGGATLILVEAVRRHREFLCEAAEAGIIHVPLGEVQRLVKIALQAGAAGTLWPNETAVPICGPAGRRELLLSGLWPELVVSGRAVTARQTQSVIDWLNRFPVPGFEQRVAESIACEYFNLRCSTGSHLRYKLARYLRMAEADPSAEGIAKPLCHAFGIDWAKVAERKARAAELPFSGHETFRCPSAFAIAKQLLGQHDSLRSIRRLTVVYLLVLEEGRRWALADVLKEELRRRADHARAKMPRLFPYRDSSAVDSLVDRVRAKCSEMRDWVVDRVGWDKLPEWYLTKTVLQDEFSAIVRPEDLEDPEVLRCLGTFAGFPKLADEPLDVEWTGILPTCPQDVACLLDPLPEELMTADANYQQGRVAAALKREGIRVEELLRGDGKCLTQSERRAGALFAVDCGFEHERWPTWMTMVF